MPTPRTDLLILDCDGVLVRSERANLAYYNHLFRAFGLPEVQESDRAALARLHTLSTPQVIETFFPPELRQKAGAFADGVDYLRFLPLLEPEPGWREVLRARRGFRRAAVATNRGRSAHRVLGAVGLLGLVDHVVTVRDVARPKPHPDLLLRCLEDLGCPAERAVYVGDSELDRAAASAAGVRFLGFRTPFPPSARDAGEVGRALANGTKVGTLWASKPDPLSRSKEAMMSQKDMFHTSDNVLKRGCQVADEDVELCPCGSKKAFIKCHGAPCECGSGKPKFKCCHTDDF